MAIIVTPQKNTGADFGDELSNMFKQQMQANLNMSMQMKSHELMQHLADVQREKDVARNTQALIAYGVDPQKAYMAAQGQPEFGKAVFKNQLEEPYNQAAAKAWGSITGGATQATGDQSAVAGTAPQQPGAMAEPTGGMKLQPPSFEGMRKDDIESLGKQYINMQQHADVMHEQELNRRQKESHFNSQQTEAKHQESAKYMEKVYGDAREIPKRLLQYDKLEELSRGGNLPSPEWSNAAQKLSSSVFGVALNFNSLMNPESEEYNKTLQEFLTGLKTVFGGKISNAEMQAYMRKFPQLVNTPEGRLRILRDLQIFSEMDLEKAKLAMQMEKENNYLRPRGFENRVEERFNKELFPQFKEEFLVPFEDIKDLPDPRSIEEDEIIEDRSTGNNWVIRHGRYVPYKKKGAK